MKLVIQASAEDDMLRQVDWYEQQGLSAVADRFTAAVSAGIHAAIKAPKAGAPRQSGAAGLRTRTVKGFDEFRIYYVIREDAFMVVRVLHERRDIDAILAEQTAIDDPDANLRRSTHAELAQPSSAVPPAEKVALLDQRYDSVHLW